MMAWNDSDNGDDEDSDSEEITVHNMMTTVTVIIMMFLKIIPTITRFSFLYKVYTKQ